MAENDPTRLDKGYGNDTGSDPSRPTPERDAEEARREEESRQAENSDNNASNRDRMVDIGRGNNQAGRQGPGRNS